MIITELSADTRAVADMLIACPVGEVITFPAIAAALGRDVRSCRHIMTSARRVVEREIGAVFTSERGEGYRRLEADRVADVVAPTARATIRRRARRTRRTLEAMMQRANDLPADTARRVSREIGVFGVMEYLARDQVAKPPADAPTAPQPVAKAARDLLASLTGEAKA